MPDAKKARAKTPRSECTSAAVKHCISLLCQIALSIRLFHHFLIDGAFSKHQVIVSALLNDATILDDGDEVRISDRLQSMGNNDGGHFSIGLVTTGFKEMIQSFLHNPLAFTVQSAERIDQTKRKRMLQE